MNVPKDRDFTDMPKLKPSLKQTAEASLEADMRDKHERCRAFGRVLDRVGNKWTVLIVGSLSHGPLRFMLSGESSTEFRTGCSRLRCGDWNRMDL